MADYIIVAALTVAVVFGIYSAIKYFNGHARSCGSAGYKPKKKKLSGVIYQKNFKVEGMHCRAAFLSRCRPTGGMRISGVKKNASQEKSLSAILFGNLVLFTVVFSALGLTLLSALIVAWIQ